MRRFLISFTAIFFTSFSHAADVYFCQGKTFTEVKDNNVKEYIPENFKFYATRTTLQFGSGGYFNNASMPISDHISHEYWYAQDKYSTAFFDAPKFHYATIELDVAKMITATCDKF